MLISTGVVLNVFEAVDVIALIKGGLYDDLNLTVGDALLKRSDVSSSVGSRVSSLGGANMFTGLPWHFHLFTVR